MCAPTSVTTLHAVLTSSLVQAYIASQVLSIASVASAILLVFRKQIVGLVRSSINLGFMKTLLSRIVGRVRQL